MVDENSYLARTSYKGEYIYGVSCAHCRHTVWFRGTAA